jgi:hypothetical protein
MCLDSFLGAVKMSGFMMFGGKSSFTIIDSPEMDREKMLFYLEKQLKYERATQVVRRGDFVTFSGTMFTFIRLRTFLEFGGRGFVRVTTKGDKLIVTYRLSFIGFLLIFLAGGLFLTITMVNEGTPDISSFMFVLLFCCVVVGFNVFIRLVSLAMFIDRTFDSFMRK